jgi:aryl-phospho-beta-D-glucosidase BglC (GH1 family)
LGLNAIRISFAPHCTDPNGFMSPYNSSKLDRAIRIGEALGLWVIIDYHGYEDMSNSTVAGCWLSFWRTVLTDFRSSYERIIWSR